MKKLKRCNLIVNRCPKCGKIGIATTDTEVASDLSFVRVSVRCSSNIKHIFDVYYSLSSVQEE